MAIVLSGSRFQEAISRQAEVLRDQAPEKLRKVYKEPRRVRFLGGVILSIALWSYRPRRPESKRGPKRGVGRRGKEPVGLHPEAAALGIRKGVSPQLQSEVGRMASLLQSMAIAREELKRKGLEMNPKTVPPIWSIPMEMDIMVLRP